MVTRSIPEIWGGIECSYTRVSDSYGDQLDFCGHYNRGIEDIELIAGLGIKALRYPIIWEKYGEHIEGDSLWSMLSRQLNTLCYYNITPIAGLVHHGSGPVHAPLDQKSFVTEIEKYSLKVARQFPWIEFYTPINEPLTTARFCGLYGLWYPHKQDAKVFAEILLNEMKAVVVCMSAIRTINPEAKLIQTEDLGKTYSTPLLRYQADFENDRRWLTNDLLCGFVKPGHPMWEYFRWIGIDEASISFFYENPCPPDLIGADYYATSERFLDEDYEKYPEHTNGSNHKHDYADVEALRIQHDAPHGPGVLLKDCWDRYNIPIAVTEVHLNGTPEEQIRWFAYIWKTCLKLRDQGVDIKAVTAWAMFGSYGWNNLLRVMPGEYERGVWDGSNGVLHSTAYTEYLRRLNRDPCFTHTAESQAGWWNLPDRFLMFDQVDVSA